MLSAAETDAAIRNAAVAVRTTRDVVRAEGADAVEYLHGQLSQNINGLAIQASAWTLVLEPQGRIAAYARVTRTSDTHFVLDVDPGFGDQLLQRLARFKLRTNIEFDLSAADIVAVRGPAVPAVADVRGDLSGDIVLAELGWPGLSGFDLIGLDGARPSLLDLPEGDASALEVQRVVAGIPRMGAELGEKTIPAEAGIVGRSVDFTKGCYVGQELVARVDSRGNNTPRRVMPVRLDGETAPLAGTELRVGDDVVGSITSAIAGPSGVVGLASIKRGNEPPFVAQLPDGGAVDVAEPSWS